MMSQSHVPVQPSYVFGPFRLIPAERLLLRDGEPVALAPKVFDTLVLLVQHHGMLVSKAELLETVWLGAFVEEGSLCNAIFALRKALGDRNYIKTVPKKGYRFVAPVEVSDVLLPTFASESRPIAPASLEPITAVRVRTNAGTVPWRTARLPRRLYLSAGVIVVLFATALLAFHGSSREKSVRLQTAKHGDGGRAVRVNQTSSSPGPTQSGVNASHAHYKYGRYFLNRRTAEDLRKAVKQFTEACRENPSAEAYAGLASSYALLNLYGSDPAQDLYPLAKAAANNALTLNSSLSEAHAAMGAVHLYYEWDWARADEEFSKALALDTRDSTAHQWYGLSLAARGQFEASLRELRLAADIDPLSLIVQTEIARVLYLSRQYDEAIEGSRRVLELDPYFLRAHIRLGEAYELKRMPSKAIEELQRAVQLSTSDVPRATLGWAYALSGQTSDARRCLSDLERTAGRDPVSPYSMAVLYAALHEPGRMFDYLEQAYRTHASAMIYLLVDPTFSPFHSDERYLDLIRRMQLDTAQAASIPRENVTATFAFLRSPVSQ